jgi:arylformamidase
MKTSISTIIGPAKVFKIDEKNFEITCDELKQLPIEKGDRVLFRTSNSDIDTERRYFVQKQARLTTAAMLYLANKQVSCIGIDYLLADDNKSDVTITELLANQNINIIQDLRLGNIGAGEYEMICLPVPATKNAAAQSRVILKPGKKLMAQSA